MNKMDGCHRSPQPLQCPRRGRFRPDRRRHRQTAEAIDEALPLRPNCARHFSPFGRRRSFHGSAARVRQVLETRYYGEYCELEAEIPESLQRRVENIVERAPRESLKCRNKGTYDDLNRNRSR